MQKVVFIYLFFPWWIFLYLLLGFYLHLLDLYQFKIKIWYLNSNNTVYVHSNQVTQKRLILLFSVSGSKGWKSFYFLFNSFQTFLLLILSFKLIFTSFFYNGKGSKLLYMELQRIAYFHFKVCLMPLTGVTILIWIMVDKKKFSC